MTILLFSVLLRVNVKTETMDSYSHWLYEYLLNQGLNETNARLLNMLGLLLSVLIFLGIVDIVIRKLLLNQFAKLSEKTKTQFDDILVNNKVPRNVAHIIPLLIAVAAIPYVLIDYPFYEEIVEKGLKVLSIFLTLWIIRGLVHSVRDYLNT